MDIEFECTQSVLRVDITIREESTTSLHTEAARSDSTEYDQKQMTDAFEVDGQKVLNWARNLGNDRARKILQGCFLDDGREEQLLEITDIDVDFALQCKAGNKTKRIPPNLLSTSTVIDERQDFPLKASLNLHKSSFEKEKEKAEQFLKSRGIPIAGITNSEDLFLLVSTFKVISPLRVVRSEC